MLNSDGLTVYLRTTYGLRHKNQKSFQPTGKDIKDSCLKNIT